MASKQIKDILVSGSDYQCSITAIMGKPIKDVYGYPSSSLGSACFKLTRIVFDDGTELALEGEHDFPYVADYNTPSPFDEDEMQRLIDEQEATNS